jgi:hypothetical protein
MKAWTRSRQSSKGVSMPRTILLRTPYARRHTGVAKSGDTSGKNAHDGVAICVERDQYELRAMSERLAEEAPERLSDSEQRREMPMTFVVGGVDMVEDEAMTLATKS